MRHTRGPWTWNKHWLNGPAPEFDVIVWYTTADDGVHCSEGDGLLIAAAPDLLASLKALEGRFTAMRMMDQGGADNMPIPAFLADARAAIAKAEGR